MGNKAYSTLGMGLRYAVETEAGKRPTTGYTVIPGIKSMPDLNSAPGTIDVTDLSDTEYKRSIKGLKSLDVAEFAANDTPELQAAWDKLMTDFGEAETAGKAVWFEIFHQKLANSTYFTGEPSEIAFSGAEVESGLETKCYVVPTCGPVREAKSTEPAQAQG